MGYAADYHRRPHLSTALIETSTETLRTALQGIRLDVDYAIGENFFKGLLDAQAAIWTILDIRRGGIGA